MDGFITFLSVVFVVFGILQIILFFKIWAMTNDVRRLQNKFAPGESLFELRKSIALGNKEKAKEIVLEYYFGKIKSPGAAFKYAKEELEGNLKKLGYELPENLKNVNSYVDFCNLYYWFGLFSDIYY
jgi:hypothetical protein